MGNKFLATSAIVHPRFELHWMSEAQRGLLLESVEQELTEAQSNHAVTSHDTAADEVTHQDDNFFNFGSARKGSGKHKSAGEGLRRYMDDSGVDVTAVLKYPRLHELCLKYNTPVLSSAPEECLFSVAGNVFRRKRGRTSDAHFEVQLLLKANKLCT